MEKTTPKEATIETIRYYEHLPEKIYRRKIFILALFDLLLLLVVVYAYYVRKHYKGMVYSVSEEVKSFIFHMVIYMAIYFIIPIIGLLIIGCFIPRFLKNVTKFLKNLKNILNPFEYKKSKLNKAVSWDYSRLYRKSKPSDGEEMNGLKEYEQQERNKEKKRKKAEPFMYFRETTPGRIVRGYFVFLHIMFYIYLFAGEETSRFFDMKDEHVIFKVYIVLFILGPIIYFLGSKEPKRTIRIAKENLKVAFHYYFSPQGKAQLSTSEKEEFQKHFSGYSYNKSYHKKAYYSNGIYHNQEVHYKAHVVVEDLEFGFKHMFTYPTDKNYENWGLTSGIEVVTRAGNYIKSRY